MELINWTGILESLLFAAGDEGLTLKQIVKVMDVPEFKAKEIVMMLKKDYEENPNRGIMLVELAEHTN